jgi:hypothetical protein
MKTDGNKLGAVVATGETEDHAMASGPTYDPNLLTGSSEGEISPGC